MNRPGGANPAARRYPLCAASAPIDPLDPLRRHPSHALLACPPSRSSPAFASSPLRCRPPPLSRPARKQPLLDVPGPAMASSPSILLEGCNTTGPSSMVVTTLLTFPANTLLSDILNKCHQMSPTPVNFLWVSIQNSTACSTLTPAQWIVACDSFDQAGAQLTNMATASCLNDFLFCPGTLQSDLTSIYCIDCAAPTITTIPWFIYAVQNDAPFSTTTSVATLPTVISMSLTIPTATFIPTSSPSPASSSSSSNIPLIAGVASGALVLLLGAVLFCLYRRRQQKARQLQASPSRQVSLPSGQSPVGNAPPPVAGNTASPGDARGMTYAAPYPQSYPDNQQPLHITYPSAPRPSGSLPRQPVAQNPYHPSLPRAAQYPYPQPEVPLQSYPIYVHPSPPPAPQQQQQYYSPVNAVLDNAARTATNSPAQGPIGEYGAAYPPQGPDTRFSPSQQQIPAARTYAGPQPSNNRADTALPNFSGTVSLENSIRGSLVRTNPTLFNPQASPSPTQTHSHPPPHPHPLQHSPSPPLSHLSESSATKPSPPQINTGSPVRINAVPDMDPRLLTIAETLRRHTSARTSSFIQTHPGAVAAAQADETGPKIELSTVEKEFVPINGDEIHMQIGDQVDIIYKFDDGWCYGYNYRTLERGVFPVDSLVK
ncbi:uncharacterized protein BJ171DRAFT_62930 [Polychytrium aggregatum]|uniref:uncharacterized protein n=1 Tax=Polychytrium aggregatum TaxID=110093 RepID=UPI0022FEC5A9|nr:uncharacterized protein BJ171DRAFT_62930 [Polychytrium aggregatum]KAI9205568.1 hypothetical protein BJ171DRAFT_62930 [Polychytrium aggregatum]